MPLDVNLLGHPQLALDGRELNNKRPSRFRSEKGV